MAELHPTYGDTRIDLTISIGVATLKPQAPCSTVQLLAEADAALYRAKRNGRNQVTVAEPHEPS